MNLQNIAFDELGAKVIEYSSSSDKKMIPDNVLKQEQDQIWNSAQGLPQYITISLQDVEIKYYSIAKIGFYCWHDYPTNPKVIEVQVSHANDDKFIVWCRLQLKQKSGKQYFQIKPFPETYRIVKFTITQTFGEYETYLNQIYIFAQTDDSNLNSMLALKDLQSPLVNSYVNKKQKTKFISKYLPRQDQLDQNDSVQSQQQPQFQENTFHHKNKYVPSPKRQPSKRSQSMSQRQSDKSIQNDIALLTLSKNVMEMQQNIEDIKRSLDVLNVKIDVTYEKIQQKFMSKIQDMIDRKLQKMKQQIKSELKKENKLRQSKSQHEKIQFLKSKQSLQEQRPNPREAKQSLHLHNLKSNRIQKQSIKQVKVSDLMDKLAMKLKERQLKIKKIESKREKEKNIYQNRSGLHRKEFI